MKDVAFSAFAGINNMVPAERVKSMVTRESAAIDLVEAVNIDIDNAMQITRRAGQTIAVDAPAHSLWTDGDMCLYVADGSMYRMDAAYAVTEIAAGLSSAPMAYAKVGQRVYHSNGDSTAVVDQGAVRSWGINIDTIQFACTAIAGQMESGTYQVAMTFVRSDGQESGAGPTQVVELPSGGGIAVAWNVPSDLGIHHAAIYVTEANGETPLRAIIVDIEAEAYDYVGGARSLPLMSQWLDAPPAGHALEHFKGRIYIAAGAFVYATAPLSYEHCDLREYRAFDDSLVTVLAAVEGGLFVGTHNAVYFMAGAGFGDNTLSRKLDAGAIRGTVVHADGEAATGNRALAGVEVVLFATVDGIVLGMPDGSLTNLTRERYTMPQGEGGAAIFVPGPFSRYLLSM